MSASLATPASPSAPPCPAEPADPATWAAAVAREAERQRRHEALARQARRIAHDANNFLTIIRTYADLLEAEFTPGEASHADVREIAKAAEGMSEYLQRSARFARAGTMRPGDVDVADAVRAALEGDDGAALAPVTTRVADAPCVVSADVVWFVEVLRGLLANAREAVGAGVPVTLAARRCRVAADAVDTGVPVPAGVWVVLEVRDPGPGPDAEVLGALGEPFVTGQAEKRGAGTTLPMVQAFAWGLGGRFVLARESDETVARLWLPAR